MEGFDMGAQLLEWWLLIVNHRYLVGPTMLGLLGLLLWWLVTRRLKRIEARFPWKWDETQQNWTNTGTTDYPVQPSPGESVGPVQPSTKKRVNYGTENDWWPVTSCIVFVYDNTKHHLHMAVLDHPTNPWQDTGEYVTAEGFTPDLAFGIRVVRIGAEQCPHCVVQRLCDFLDSAPARRWASHVERDGMVNVFELLERSPVDAMDDITRSVLR